MAGLFFAHAAQLASAEEQQRLGRDQTGGRGQKRQVGVRRCNVEGGQVAVQMEPANRTVGAGCDNIALLSKREATMAEPARPPFDEFHLGMFVGQH